MKRRFPCVQQVMRLRVDNVRATIVAVAVLHNIAIAAGDPIFGDDLEDEGDIDFNLNQCARGDAVRRTIIENYFD